MRISRLINDAKLAKLDERPLFAMTMRLPWHAVSPMGSYVFEKPGRSA